MVCKVRVNRIIKKTKTEGFGKRYCIWVQGCSIRCSGCKNQHMWSFKGGEEVEIDRVIRDIELQEDIEGITFLGGEPLDQKEAVTEILKAAKKQRLSTIVFTGYRYEELLCSSETRKLLKYTDLLIDGEFRQEEMDFSRPWIGSKNQRYLFLSDRYEKGDLLNRQYKTKYELRIYPEGTIMVNGIGNLEILEQILDFNVEEGL